jgi:hypothetical protein
VVERRSEVAQDMWPTDLDDPDPPFAIFRLRGTRRRYRVNRKPGRNAVATTLLSYSSAMTGARV